MQKIIKHTNMASAARRQIIGGGAPIIGGGAYKLTVAARRSRCPVILYFPIRLSGG